MGSANRLKLGLFGANCSSGRAVTTVPERWSGSWPDCVKLAQMADRAGIEFMLPIGRWKGYGGDTDYQGATWETVTWALCRSHLGPDDARQPATPVVRLDGLCADLRLASHRHRPHPVRPRLVWHDPSQAAENRRLGARQRAPHQTRHAHRLPLSGRISRRARRAERRCHGLTNQTAPPPYPFDTSQEQCPLQDSQKLNTMSPTNNQCFLHVSAPLFLTTARKINPAVRIPG